jgi:ribosomal protein L30
LQRATLLALWLSKIGRIRVQPDTPMTRGMIRMVQHLVRVMDGSKYPVASGIRRVRRE